MSQATIDLEEQPLVGKLRSTSTASNMSPLQVYTTLVGDADNHTFDDSIYQNVVAGQRKASIYYLLSGFAFFGLVATQIVLCLGIAVGAQLGLTMDEITIMAAVNTGVAASIGVLKGLGLPEKKAVERRKLTKLAEHIRYTTRKLRAGISLDAAQEADEVLKMQNETEDDGQVLQQAGDAAKAVPDPNNEKK